MPAGTSDQFAARESGDTAGVTEQGGQAVFASSTAPNGKAAGANPGSGSAAPSEGSAVGDAWSGFSSATTSANGSGTPATALGQDGSSGFTLGIAILGLGLAGILGTFVVLAAPRRRRAGADGQATSRKRGAKRDR